VGILPTNHAWKRFHPARRYSDSGSMLISSAPISLVATPVALDSSTGSPASTKARKMRA
jgi:hypothetical protein